MNTDLGDISLINIYLMMRFDAVPF